MDKRWQILLVTSLGVFVASLDLFIVNIAFPEIARDFSGTSLGDLSWILNAYAIVFAALLVPAGRIADRIGRKRMFLIGMATFTAASALCALAPSVGALVAARVLQAAGGGDDHAEHPRADPARVPGGQARRRGRDLVGGRRGRGRARPADRRPAGRGRLALDLHRQRPGRDRRDGRRAPGPRRGPRAGPRPAARRRRAPLLLAVSIGLLTGGDRPGSRLGLGRRAGRRRVCRGGGGARGCSCGVRAATRRPWSNS